MISHFSPLSPCTFRAVGSAWAENGVVKDCCVFSNS